MADRELNLKLGTKADGNIADPLEKLSRASKDAAEQEKRYQEILKGRHAALGQIGGGGGASLGQLGRGAASLNAGGMAQGAMGMMAGAGPAAAVMAAFAAITEGAGKAANAMNVLNNGAMTAAQKQDALAKEFIPGAEALIRFRDAMTGVTESLRVYHLEHAKNMLKIGETQALAMRPRALSAEQLHHEERAKAYDQVKVPDSLNRLAGGRDTYAGELEYQRAAARFPAETALERATADRDATKAEMRDSAYRLNKLKGERRRLIGDADVHTLYGPLKNKDGEVTAKARAEYENLLRGKGEVGKAAGAELDAFRAGNVFGADAGENKVQRTQAALSSLEKQQEALNNEARIQAEINRQKELGVSLAEKESQIRKEQNNLLKAELQLLQQKEQRQSHAASSLGMMHPAQQMMAVQAARLAKQGMPINLMPPQMRSMLQQVNPGYVNKLAETQGAGSEAFKQLQEMGVVDKGNLAETRKEMAKVQTQVEVNVNLDVAALSKEIAQTLGKSIGELIKSIRAEFFAERQKNTSGNQLRNASQ